MARLTLAKALTLRDSGLHFRRGVALEIEDEALYSRLIHSGKVTDPDKNFGWINPVHTLPRLPKGSSVIVVRDSGLGDVLMLLPVLRAIKKKYPHLKLTYATSRMYVPMLQGIPFLDHVEPVIDMTGKFSNVIDLRGYTERSPLRNTVERIEIFARYCGVEVEDYSMPIHVSEESRAEARDLIGVSPSIALALRGSTPHRTWPRDRVLEFAALAAEAGYAVMMLDRERDEFEELKTTRIMNLTGSLSILPLMALISEADFVVSPDSGLVHLAEAVGTKCVTIFSTIAPALRLAHYKHVKCLWRRDLKCAPCNGRGCRPIPCLAEVTGEQVLHAIENWDQIGAESNPKLFALISAAAS